MTDISQVKLLTIGDSGVGKSWLLMRWAGETGKLNKNASSMPTIGIDFKMKTIVINDKRVKVQVVSIIYFIIYLSFILNNISNFFFLFFFLVGYCWSRKISYYNNFLL